MSLTMHNLIIILEETMTDSRALVTLTSEESKRLIAKGITAYPSSKSQSGGSSGSVFVVRRGMSLKSFYGPLPASNPYTCGFVSRLDYSRP